MTDLAPHLERLGLEQYLDVFIEEGFDTWETLLDVQERDLEALKVKLGHRRRLQRAIADYRGISYERLTGPPATPDVSGESSRLTEGSQTATTRKESTSTPLTNTKRKYRRHPKADENAPEKPPSAYVLFSNKIREEVKAESLSFTEIAKLVGDRWQKLDPSQKEPFESQAAALKEQYNIQLSAYKKTDAYKEYAQYLADFKAKHGPQNEPKRPKLDPQSSGGSVSATSIEVPETSTLTSGHVRVGSISSTSAASLVSAITSPPISQLAPVTALANMPTSVSRGLPSLARSGSPQPIQHGRDPRRIVLSAQSSNSDDSGHTYDALSQTATALSLSTPPTNTPPLPAHALSLTRSSQGSSGDGFPWPSRGQPVLQQNMSTSSGPSPLGTGVTLPSPTFSSDIWRERQMDWSRPVQTSPTSATGGPPPTLPLPPLLNHDRSADLGHGQSQRILPPLRHNPPLGLPPSSYQSGTPTSQLSRQVSGEAERGFSQPFDSGGRQLDRHENEAASALAGLAARPGHETPHARSYDRQRPS